MSWYSASIHRRRRAGLLGRIIAALVPSAIGVGRAAPYISDTRRISLIRRLFAGRQPAPLTAERRCPISLSPPIPPRAVSPVRWNGPGSRGWPDYDRCLRNAPQKEDGTPDRSRVDFLWSKWALERGNSPASVMGKLLEVSEKARQEWDRGNENYVLRTVESAGRAVR